MWITIASVLTIFILGSLSLYFFVFKDKKFTLGGSKTEAGISLHNVYDEDGNPISTDAQATVGGVSGVRYLTFRVNAINKDTVQLTFNILDATPVIFKTALNPPSTNIAESESMASWISDLVDIQGMEGTIQTFSVEIEATSQNRKAVTKGFSVDVKIDEDPEAGFDIEIVGEAGDDPVFGEPPECTLDAHCGENMICDNEICIPDPDAPECEIDSDCTGDLICVSGVCVEPPEQDKVLFRTTNLDYSTSDTAIAYAFNGCGTDLIAYGRTGGACINHRCNNPSGATLINAPASFGSITTTYVWIESEERACVCEPEDIGVSTYPRRYDSDYDNAMNVPTTPISIDPELELMCTH